VRPKVSKDFVWAGQYTNVILILKYAHDISIMASALCPRRILFGLGGGRFPPHDQTLVLLYQLQFLVLISLVPSAVAEYDCNTASIAVYL